MQIVLVNVVGVLIIIGLVMAGRAAERKRREFFEQYALTHGFTFEAAGSDLPSKLGPLFPIFQLGYNRTWQYVMKGSQGGAPFSAFEFRYTTGGGRSSTTHWVAMMCWETPGREWPRFMVAPEDWWERVKQRFGARDFDFPEDPSFSEGYVLQGEDEAKVRALFDGPKRAYLTAIRHTHAAGAGSFLLWWRVHPLYGADKLDTFLHLGESFRQVFIK
ncbi:MAG TPA: hypothetical protein VJN62_05145 [Gemmatimonadales bacterium]|nr:hypothetical protein [Gemmatimonadales bacterium]